MHIHFFISLRQVDMRSYANKRSVHACRTIYLLGPPGTYLGIGMMYICHALMGIGIYLLHLRK